MTLIERLSLIGIVLLALIICTWVLVRNDGDDEEPEDWDELAAELERQAKAEPHDH